MGLKDVVIVLQRDRLRRYGHVLRKDNSEWVKKCTSFVVEGCQEIEKGFYCGELRFLLNKLFFVNKILISTINDKIISNRHQYHTVCSTVLHVLLLHITFVC